MNKIYFEFDPRDLTKEQAILKTVELATGWDNIDELKITRVVANSELWCVIAKLLKDV